MRSANAKAGCRKSVSSLGPDDRLCSARVSSATSLYQKSAFRRWWSHSTLRKLVQEIGKFPLRILASRQLPTWGLFRLPQTPSGLPQNSFLQSCSESTQLLCKEHPWAGFLDAQILAESYARGAAWAYSNFGTKTSKPGPKKGSKRKPKQQMKAVP